MFACKRSCTSNRVIWIEEKCDEFISYEESLGNEHCKWKG